MVEYDRLVEEETENYFSNKASTQINPVSATNPLRAGPIPATPKGPWTELVLPTTLNSSFIKKIEWTLSGSTTKDMDNEREVADWIRAAKYTYQPTSNNNLWQTTSYDANNETGSQWDNVEYKYYGVKGWALVGKVTTKASLSLGDYMMVGL